MNRKEKKIDKKYIKENGCLFKGIKNGGLDIINVQHEESSCTHGYRISKMKPFCHCAVLFYGYCYKCMRTFPRN